MRTHFDPAVRLLACDHCGAPLGEASGTVDQTCGFCGAHNQLDVPAVIEAGPALSREGQMRRLVAQQGQPRTPSSAVAEFLDGERLAAWREREALAAWVELRRGLREQPEEAAAARLFELTRLLADAAHEAGKSLEERALLESAYEMAHLPRQRTFFAARLAQRAAAAGDSESARAWIARCDAAIDDLEAFSALVIATALAARVDGRPEETLSAIGTADRPAPLLLSDEGLGAVLRADALEQTGELDDAVSTLERFVVSRWPRTRAEVVRVRESLGGEPCPRAMTLLDERRGREFQRLHRYNMVVGIVFAVIWGGAGVAAGVGAAYGSLWLLVGTVFGVAAGVGFIWMAVNQARSLGTWRHPVWATVQKVNPSDDGGGGAYLLLDDHPEETERINYDSHADVSTGMRALVVRTHEGVRWLA